MFNFFEFSLNQSATAAAVLLAISFLVSSFVFSGMNLKKNEHIEFKKEADYLKTGPWATSLICTIIIVSINFEIFTAKLLKNLNCKTLIYSKIWQYIKQYMKKSLHFGHHIQRSKMYQLTNLIILCINVLKITNKKQKTIVFNKYL